VALLREDLTPGDYDAWLSAAARFDLPVFRFDVALRDADGWTLVDDRPALQAPAEYRLRRLVPDGRHEGGGDETDAILTFREVATGRAPERAAAWVFHVAEQDAARLEEVTLELSCRFTCRPCPAASYAAAWVDERGVRPCPPAPARDMRPLEDLAALEAAAHTAERRRRGCATCVVRETCPKCLHTAPLEPAEYCRVQKRGKMLEAAMLLEIARLLGRSEPADGRPAAGGLRLGRVLGPGTHLTGHWQTTTLLVTAWRETVPILYDPGNVRLWQVPEPLSLVLELGGRGELEALPGADSLCRALERLGVARSTGPPDP
jgi:hypothetical protein